MPSTPPAGGQEAMGQRAFTLSSSNSVYFAAGTLLWAALIATTVPIPPTHDIPLRRTLSPAQYPIWLLSFMVHVTCWMVLNRRHPSLRALNAYFLVADFFWLLFALAQEVLSLSDRNRFAIYSAGEGLLLAACYAIVQLYAIGCDEELRQSTAERRQLMFELITRGPSALAPILPVVISVAGCESTIVEKRVGAASGIVGRGDMGRSAFAAGVEGNGIEEDGKGDEGDTQVEIGLEADEGRNYMFSQHDKYNSARPPAYFRIPGHAD
ncbi:hypothetical protein JCM11251_003622 [Rhodosporidiobolus azoricus]